MDEPSAGFGIIYLTHHMWDMAEAFDRGIRPSSGSVVTKQNGTSLPTRNDVFALGAYGFATKRFNFRNDASHLGTGDISALFGPAEDHFELRDMWLTVALDAWQGMVPPLLDVRWPRRRQHSVIEAGSSWACEPRSAHEMDFPVGVRVSIASGGPLF